MAQANNKSSAFNTSGKKSKFHPSKSLLGVVEGRLSHVQAEKKKIELQEKINYQHIQQQEAKHEEEKFKTGQALTRVDIAEMNYRKLEIDFDIAEIERDINTVNKDAKYIELGIVEDKLNLLETKAELDHDKTIKQLEGLSIEIDELDFKNNERKQIGSAFGVNFKNRSFPVQEIKSYLKGVS